MGGTENQAQVDMEEPEGSTKSTPISCSLVTTTNTSVEAQQILSRKHWATSSTATPYVLLALVQFLVAGYQILSRVALASGLNLFLFTFYRNLAAFLILAPAAYYLERDVRPKLSLATFGRLNILAFFGILGNQQLFLTGLALTTPLYAAVSQNMTPVLPFLFAVLLGLQGIANSAISVVIQAWCVQQMGAFIVSLFNPFQTLIVACLAILLLGDSLCLGILLEGVLVVGGFYTVLCGQQMDRSKRGALDLKCSGTKAGDIGVRSSDDRKQSDIEKPLLSLQDV